MGPRDVIFVSDLDEIPRASAAKRAVKLLQKRKDISLVFLELGWFELFLNGQIFIDEAGRQVPHSWCRPYAGLWKYLKQPGLTFTDIRRPVRRKMHRRKDIVKLENAGWHFTWTGGAEMLARKVNCRASGSDTNENWTTEDYWNMLIEDIKSHVPHHTIKIIPVDETFPKFVRENLEDFIEKGLVAPL